MSQAFVDTWAWVALVDKKDSDHEKAKSVNKKLLDQGYTFVTTNFVFGETVTMLRYRVSHASAIKYHQMLNEMVDGGLVRLVRISEAQEKDAWQIFEKYTDQDFSHVDCASFAVMRTLALHEAFTNDHHFRIMGFITHP
jgi:predicted nucleic acid-binding protein